MMKSQAAHATILTLEREKNALTHQDHPHPKSSYLQTVALWCQSVLAKGPFV